MPAPTGKVDTVDLAFSSDIAFRSDVDPELRLTAFLYEQVFGHKATLLTFGAGGLTLFGRVEDRFALAMPMKWGATVAGARRSDGMIELRSGSQAGKELLRPLDELDDLPAWAACPLAVVSAARAAGHPLGGMSLLVGTALPEGAGMQSEIALTAVVAAALGELFGTELALAQKAPLGDLAAQLAASSAPDGTALLVDRRRMTAEPVPFDLAAAGLRLMIIDLGGKVKSSPVAGAGDLALEAVEVLRRGDLSGLGPLFGRATSLAGAEAVGSVVDAACHAGALGAGTLPGGCLTALVPVDRLSPVRAAVTAAWPGERAPKFLTAVPSRGGRARRRF